MADLDARYEAEERGPRYLAWVDSLANRARGASDECLAALDPVMRRMAAGLEELQEAQREVDLLDQQLRVDLADLLPDLHHRSSSRASLPMAAGARPSALGLGC